MSMFSVETNRVSLSRLLYSSGYERTTLLEDAHPSQRLISFVPFKNKGIPLPLEDQNVRPK